MKIFIEVVEQGSFSRAAASLYVTPTAVMKQMNLLESRLELKLFQRNNQGIELTKAGKYLYRVAKKIVAESEDAVRIARGLQKNQVKTIRVGSSLLFPGNVLIDLWNSLSPDPDEYRFQLVQFDDSREHLPSAVASLGKTMDFMVGALNFRQIRNLGMFYELGQYHVCIAVPRSHPLALKDRLTVRDLYGEHLITLKQGEMPQSDHIRMMLKTKHPQILLKDTPSLYDLETFNACETTGTPLLTLDAWADIHSSLVTIPVDLDVAIPYGLVYSPNIAGNAAVFLTAVRNLLRKNNFGSELQQQVPL